MATQLYCRSNLVVPALWTGTAGFSLKDAGRGVTPGSELFEGSRFDDDSTCSLSTAIGSSIGEPLVANSVTGPTSGILVGTVTDPCCFLSPPLAAAATIAGTIAYAMCGSEGNMSANATLRMALYRVSPTGTLTLISNSTAVTELGTSLTRLSWNATPTSTACAIGDRLLLLPMFDDAAALTMASGSSLVLQVNGTNANTADSNFTLTETLSFITSDPSGSVYYLRDTASDVSGAKALSATQGAGTVEAVHTTVVGPLTFPGDQWTATAGGADIEWFTPQLSAFTLSAAVMVTLTNNAAVLESFATPFDCITIELAVTDSDGSNPSVWGQSYTSTNATADKVHYLTGPDHSVSAGQRLRLRVYQDDYRPFGNAVAGTDRTIRYDGVSTYASRLTFTQTLTEFTPGTALPIPRRDRRIVPLI